MGDVMLDITPLIQGAMSECRKIPEAVATTIIQRSKLSKYVVIEVGYSVYSNLQWYQL